MSEEFTIYLKSKGTKCHVTVHNTSEHNGVAKHLNRILVERVHAMIHAVDLPKVTRGKQSCMTCR